MKATKEADSIRHPEVRINHSLEEYKNAPIFQEKVKRAKEVLARVGLPDLVEVRRSRRQHSAG